jgi:glutamine amidotransferase
VALENTHPFVRELWGRYWVLAHNGDLKGFAPRLHAAFRPVGDTDSERALCWLMQELSKAHASVPTLEELTLTLAELMPVLAGHGSFNMLLSNGQALWAHASTKLHWLLRQHPFGAATLADADLSVDFAPLTTPGDRIALVATEPLTVGESWQAMVPGELRMFVGGLPAG